MEITKQDIEDKISELNDLVVEYDKQDGVNVNFLTVVDYGKNQTVCGLSSPRGMRFMLANMMTGKESLIPIFKKAVKMAKHQLTSNAINEFSAAIKAKASPDDILKDFIDHLENGKN